MKVATEATFRGCGLNKIQQLNEHARGSLKCPKTAVPNVVCRNFIAINLIATK